LKAAGTSPFWWWVRKKAEILSVIRAGGSQVPAARIKPVGELIWFVDRAADNGD